MTMTDIEKYNRTRRFIALITGPYGEAVVKKYPEIKSIAEKAIDKLRKDAYFESINNNQNIKENQDVIKDLRKLKNIIPETSYETNKQIRELEIEVNKKLQELVDYNPRVYYEIYFLLNGMKPSDSLLHDISKNYNFFEWFSTSKVVNDKNQPLVVYHGTGGFEEQFTKFQFSMFPGVYFAENKTYSDWFAKLKAPGMVYECYLQVINPLDLSVFKTDKITYDDLVAYIELKFGYRLPENPMLKQMSNQMGGMWVWRYLRAGVDWLKYIKDRKEFDGIHFYENNPDDMIDGTENITPAWMVFEPNQIKSMSGNLLYNLHSPDIRFEEGGKI